MLFALMASVTLDPPADFTSFRQQANEIVLSGEALPRDYLAWLNRLDQADRLMAIAYLRRVGLLTDPPVPLVRVINHAEEGK